MTTAPDVSELNAQLEKARLAFRLSQARLKAELGVTVPGDGAEDILLSHANEFGIEETLKRVRDDTGYFEMGAAPSPSSLNAIKPELEKALGLLKRMEAIVSMRENIFQKVDPGHNRAYTWLGREFIVLPDDRAIKYLDTGKVENFGMVPVAQKKKAGKERGR